MLVFLSSCLEEENPCPDAIINIAVDSTDFSYTITAEGLEEIIYEWRVNGSVVETEDLDDLRDNLLNFTFEPGTYNVCITGESELCGGTIEICREIVIEKNPCPELEFDYEQISHEKFIFELDDDTKVDIAYAWLIDGDTVEMASFEDDEELVYYHYFEPGTYEVCLAPKDAECDVVYCEEIVVEEVVCPEPFFEYDEVDGQWVFIADFEGKEETTYKWYLDDDIVDKENYEGIETDHKLVKELGPGEHVICLVIYTDLCEEVEFCKKIVIEGEEDDCILPDFTATRVEEQLAYSFAADFEGQNDIDYAWSVFTNDDFLGGEERKMDSEDDHEFFWQFEQGVVYEVCLSFESDCGEKKVCKTFKIE